MSGGSYGYLYQGMGFIMDFDTYHSLLSNMINDAASAADEGEYDPRVVDVLRQHLAAMDDIYAMLDTQHERVASLLRAIEWNKSGDVGPEAVNTALARMDGGDDE